MTADAGAARPGGSPPIDAVLSPGAVRHAGRVTGTTVTSAVAAPSLSHDDTRRPHDDTRRPHDDTRRPQDGTRERGPPRVPVLGAGCAGLLAALRPAPHASGVLIDPGDRFTERVRLHERATGVRPDISHPLSGFLRPAGIEHIAARATGIDPAARTVMTDHGLRLPYDRLVHALGSRTASAGDRAHTTGTAAGLHKRLQDGPGSAAVVGGVAEPGSNAPPNSPSPSPGRA